MFHKNDASKYFGSRGFRASFLGGARRYLQTPALVDIAAKFRIRKCCAVLHSCLCNTVKQNMPSTGKCCITLSRHKAVLSIVQHIAHPPRTWHEHYTEIKRWHSKLAISIFSIEFCWGLVKRAVVAKWHSNVIRL